MKETPLSGVLRFLRGPALRAELGELEDRQLVERFLRQRDEAAFALILRRHGPMVLAVCRRVLGNVHDAEDAYQATFLVLVRKAHSLGRRELLANWLYGVAYRTAHKARAQTARRRRRELSTAINSQSVAPLDIDWSDERLVLDEELNRLPEKYRVPIILCYLEGMTFEDTARRLGWPTGTVSGRLSRAREILRKRLSRRGLTLSATMPADALANQLLSEAVPSSLVNATLDAAMASAAGQALVDASISGSVSFLVKGVVQEMFWSKMKFAALLLAAGGVIGGAGVASYGQRPVLKPASTQESVALPFSTSPPAPEKQSPKEEQTFKEYLAEIELKRPWGDQKTSEDRERLVDRQRLLGTTPPPLLSEGAVKSLLESSRLGKKMRRLLSELLEGAKVEFENRRKEFLAGRGTTDILLGACERVQQAELTITRGGKGDQAAVFERHVKRLEEIHNVNKERYEAGLINTQELAQTYHALQEAKILLEKAKHPLGEGAD